MGPLIHLTVSCLLFLIGLPVWFNRQPAQDAGNPAANSSTRTSHLSCTRALAFAVWPNVYAHAIDHPKTEAFATTLFAQSAVQVLDRSFPQPDVSYLLLDANSGALLASRWENPDHSIP